MSYMTYLAVSIAADDVTLAGVQIEAAKAAGAEMIELRTDYLAGLDGDKVDTVLEAAKATGLPIIVTCRDSSEGGANDYPQGLRVDMLVRSVRAGADFIDCEYANYLSDDVRVAIDTVLDEHSGCRLILSAHDFEGMFDDLDQLYADIVEARGDAIPKLVYTAGHINDCFAAIDLLREKRGDAIVLCMGQAGLMMRVLAKKFGGFVTFASLDAASATAPGQVTVEEMNTSYRWDSVGADTKLFGVIGSPVGHSMSPAIFNACFGADGVDGLYLPLLVEGQSEEFETFIDNVTTRERLGQLDFGGFSVTIPHKAHALDHAEKMGQYVEALAANIGAVNTLKIGVNGSVSAYNTDFAGAMDALAAAMGTGRHGLHGVKVAVVGAGGVGRAIVAGLVDVGAKVTVYNRTVHKAQSLGEEFDCRWAGLDEMPSMDAKVIVNCTSIGMYPEVDASPVPVECLKRGMVVFDTVYNPLETLLLKQTRAAGAQTVSGAEMFVRQAMAQYKLFVGRDADEDLMRATVLEKLGR